MTRRKLSEHLRLEIAHTALEGHEPGDPPPLDPGEPVPGCACERCTGTPAPAPRPRPRRRGDDLPVEDARRVPILEVADRLGLEVKRVGRSHRAPCPIHKGDDPNFAVVPEEGFYKCHVCGAGGDGIDLWQAVRGVSFSRAVRELAA